jgi:2-polyprenyl-6-methoxyphenol hydroxylase-like FAD-dependent oxidoreductase
VHLNPENFKSFFEKRIKKRFTVDSELNAKNQFNLKLKTLDSIFDKRVLAIGDAAHIIHPMAGQGLNLGLRDIRAIEALLESSKIADAGNENFLRRYEKMRKKDVAQLALLTDVLSNTVHGEHYVNKLNKGSIIPAAINGLLKNKFLKQAIIKQATQ